MFLSNLARKKVIFSFAVLTAIFTFLIIQTKAAETSDAIAVRIMPNPNHYSIETWYRQQGYQGAPQKLTVDGYEAVRDGRTVFVNAANIDNNNLYTNIYLISYNQDSNIKTVDILGQLVSHWKFNSNLNILGRCVISKIACSNNSCPTDYLCSTGNAASNTSFGSANKGKCLPKIEQQCLVDSDCPVNLFCDSAKAKVTRDVKRLGQLGDIKEALKVISAQNSRFPELAGGTYVPGNTISTWPSWQETFWPKLSGLALMTDPINVLGDCPGFEAATCWKKVENQFYQTSNGKLILPAGSYTYLYSSEKNGINYNLCTTFETNGLYKTADDQLSKDACVTTGISANTPPKISDSFLTGESGWEFNGYIKAEDDQGDTISWRLDTGSTNFLNWSNKPILKDSGILNQKRIYAAEAGAVGNYLVILTLTDSRGLLTSYPLTIKITANKPIIEADNIDYLVDPIVPLNYTFFVYSTNGINPDQITITKRDSGTLNLFNFPDAKETKVEAGLNRFRIDKSVFIPAGTSIPENMTIVYRITATDKKGNIAQKDININLISEKPNLDFNCDTNARVSRPYPINNIPCLIGPLKQGNHSISYSLAAYSGLSLQTREDGQSVLSGTAPSVTSASTQVAIMAINEYGATSSKSFLINVNDYCGDGKIQRPNLEGKGGISNDGVESCDGTDGVTTTVSTSAALQYGCTTTNDNNYPILNNQSCIFKDGNSGGGYCGDGLCQFKVNNIEIENACNCSIDCGQASATADASNCQVTPPAGLCGNGMIDSGEECDGLNLNSKTCQSIDPNYNVAGLTCDANCKFSYSTCTYKSCWRNSDCVNNHLCRTVDKSTVDYYCTSTTYSHGCNTGPFTTTALKNQCAGGYVGGTIFTDDGATSSVKYNQCSTACESAKLANSNKNYCDWVVSGGRCAPAVPCTSFTYSDWGSCQNGLHYRTITSQTPPVCGGDPVIVGLCTPTPPCQPSCSSPYYCGSDGCGGTCSCPNSMYVCGTNHYCETKPIVCKTCADLGLSCGSANDGCGKPLNCGSCADKNYSCNNGKCVKDITCKDTGAECICGNGIPEWGEICDQGIIGNTDNPPSSYLNVYGNHYCTTDCKLKWGRSCGDGVCDPEEKCGVSCSKPDAAYPNLFYDCGTTCN